LCPGRDILQAGLEIGLVVWNLEGGCEETYLDVARSVHVGAGAGLELCRGGGDGEDGEDGGELHCAGFEGAGIARGVQIGGLEELRSAEDGEEISVEGNPWAFYTALAQARRASELHNSRLPALNWGNRTSLKHSLPTTHMPPWHGVVQQDEGICGVSSAQLPSCSLTLVPHHTQYAPSASMFGRLMSP
jgi:hypothetical protein